jgi:hypothetical protein
MGIDRRSITPCHGSRLATTHRPILGRGGSAACLPRPIAHPGSGDPCRGCRPPSHDAMGPVRHAPADPWDLPAHARHRPHRRFVTTESCSDIEPHPPLPNTRIRRWSGADSTRRPSPTTWPDPSAGTDERALSDGSRSRDGRASASGMQPSRRGRSVHHHVGPVPDTTHATPVDGVVPSLSPLSSLLFPLSSQFGVFFAVRCVL